MSECKCRSCKPVLDGMRADISPFRSEPTTAEMRPLEPVQRVTTVDLIQDAFARGQRAERLRCADVALLYPLENFAYAGDTGELLRLRDAISQAIEKQVPVGQSIP